MGDLPTSSASPIEASNDTPHPNPSLSQPPYVGQRTGASGESHSNIALQGSINTSNGAGIGGATGNSSYSGLSGNMSASGNPRGGAMGSGNSLLPSSSSSSLSSAAVDLVHYHQRQHLALLGSRGGSSSSITLGGDVQPIGSNVLFTHSNPLVTNDMMHQMTPVTMASWLTESGLDKDGRSAVQREFGSMGISGGASGPMGLVGGQMASVGGQGGVVTGQDPHPEHSKMILRGLNSMRRDNVLCDVTLMAEGQNFEVHKVILVSCSDYFRSMFTSGMKETKQREIELKGVTAKGLEKVLDIIYTSTTKIEGDDVFDIIAAATHLQVTPVIEFCEQNFLSGMNTSNFYDFINTARLYNMTNVLTQIDRFIAKNLLRIAEEGTLNLLTYDQVLNCVRSCYCTLVEIELFDVIWEWINLDLATRHQFSEQLMTEVRFKLISPTDLVQKVQSVPIMMQNPRLRDMVLKALNYHVIPFSQPLSTGQDMELRCFKERIVCVGGREIHPHPGLSEDLVILPLYDNHITPASLVNKKTLSHLPTAVSHGQVVVFNNFLFVLGGCTTQCAHGESAVNLVMRFDPRFMCWYQCEPMLHKRAYFFGGVVKRRIIAVGGRRKEGSLAFCELYNPEDNTWEAIASLQSAFHAHAGVVHGDYVFISGGYSNDNFYPDMQRYDINTNQWDDMAPMLTARGWHVMCSTGDKIYVAGGCSLNANNQALPVLQCEQYDPLTDSWTVIAPLSVSHKEANCVLFHSSLYILGGYNTQMKTGQKLVSRYDLGTGHWDSLAAFPTSMTGVGACRLKLPGFFYQFDDI